MPLVRDRIGGINEALPANLADFIQSRFFDMCRTSLLRSRRAHREMQ